MEIKCQWAGPQTLLYLAKYTQKQNKEYKIYLKDKSANLHISENYIKHDTMILLLRPIALQLYIKSMHPNQHKILSGLMIELQNSLENTQLKILKTSDYIQYKDPSLKKNSFSQIIDISAPIKYDGIIT